MFSLLICCGSIIFWTVTSKELSDEHLMNIYNKIENLENELQTVKEKNRMLNQEVVDLKNENSKRIAEARELKSENQNIKSKLNFILDIVAHRQDNIQSNRSLVGTRSILHDNARAFHSDDRETEGNGDQDNVEKEKVRRLLLPVTTAKPPVKDSSIAFQAYHPSHQQNLGIHQMVEFTSVITNIGSAYNPVTSVFVAPVDGLYYFSATILSFSGEDIETEIVLNGNPVSYIYTGGKSYGSGSTSGVLQLSANDDVWIRVFNNPSINDGNIRVHGGKWSSFCGFKIA